VPFPRIAESFAQLADRCVKTVVEIHKGICRPELLVQSLAGYQLAPLPQKGNEQLEGFFLQMDFAPMLTEFACFQVDFKRTEAKRTRRLARDEHNSQHAGTKVYHRELDRLSYMMLEVL
jgi:hypothetical protein